MTKHYRKLLTLEKDAWGVSSLHRESLPDPQDKVYLQQSPAVETKAARQQRRLISRLLHVHVFDTSSLVRHRVKALAGCCPAHVLLWREWLCNAMRNVQYIPKILCCTNSSSTYLFLSSMLILRVPDRSWICNLDQSTSTTVTSNSSPGTLCLLKPGRNQLKNVDSRRKLYHSPITTNLIYQWNEKFKKRISPILNTSFCYWTKALLAWMGKFVFDENSIRPQLVIAHSAMLEDEPQRPW